MKLLLLIMMSIFTNPSMLYDFNASSDLSGWRVVLDGVMGGISDGDLSINEKGNAVFKGQVRLEYNGGFSMVQYSFDQKDVSAFSHVRLRVKGDGKKYQFRAKSDAYQRFSYITHFETTGEWQEIEIPLSELYPAFRGMTLNMPNYPGEELAQIAFLIGNKKAEAFELEIDNIALFKAL